MTQPPLCYQLHERGFGPHRPLPPTMTRRLATLLSCCGELALFSPFWLPAFASLWSGSQPLLTAGVGCYA